MAGDCFIRLQGRTQGKFAGESQDREFSEAIDVESWRWTGQREASGGARQRGALRLGELVFTHRVDAGSVQILSALAAAEACTAELIMRRAGGEAQKYLTIRLEKVLVVKVELVFGGAEERLPLESVSLAYEKVEVEYTAQAGTGMRARTKTWTHDLYSTQ